MLAFEVYEDKASHESLIKPRSENEEVFYAGHTWDPLCSFSHFESLTLEFQSYSVFVFDGSNSDITQELYVRYKAGDSCDQAKLTSIPTTVTDQLELHNGNFQSLQEHAQRAVIWDADFVSLLVMNPSMWSLWS
ncbi:hypothetical protein PRIC2_014254 [Phytophthora ramorum]